MQQSQFLLYQCFAGPVDVACADGEDDVALPDIGPQELGDLGQGLAVGGTGDPLHQITGGNADQVLLPGGVDLRHHADIHPLQLLDEILDQGMGPGVGTDESAYGIAKKLASLGI